MIVVKNGTYVEKIRNGMKDGKAWCVGTVCDEKGYHHITVFVINSDELDLSRPIKVKYIMDARNTSKKGTGKYEGRWFEDFSLSCVCENSDEVTPEKVDKITETEDLPF